MDWWAGSCGAWCGGVSGGVGAKQLFYGSKQYLQVGVHLLSGYFPFSYSGPSNLMRARDEAHSGQTRAIDPSVHSSCSSGIVERLESICL